MQGELNRRHELYQKECDRRLISRLMPPLQQVGTLPREQLRSLVKCLHIDVQTVTHRCPRATRGRYTEATIMFLLLLSSLLLLSVGLEQKKVENGYFREWYFKGLCIIRMSKYLSKGLLLFWDTILFKSYLCLWVSPVHSQCSSTFISHPIPILHQLTSREEQLALPANKPLF